VNLGSWVSMQATFTTAAVAPGTQDLVAQQVAGKGILGHDEQDADVIVGLAIGDNELVVPAGKRGVCIRVLTQLTELSGWRSEPLVTPTEANGAAKSSSSLYILMVTRVACIADSAKRRRCSARSWKPSVKAIPWWAVAAAAAAPVLLIGCFPVEVLGSHALRTRQGLSLSPQYLIEQDEIC
jgi:hypothetical protein